MPGPVSRTDTLNEPLLAAGLDDHFARIGELDGVADQIEQHLRQAAFVAAAAGQVGRHIGLECELLVERQRLDRVVDRLGHVLQRIIGEVERELAGLDLGKVEHGVDQAEQMPAVALDPFEHGLHLVRRLAIDAVRDQLGVAQDGVERRAQLVAHVGEELRLVLARLGKLAALVLDFVEQPNVLDRDHRLVGEGGDQLDLLVGEGCTTLRSESMTPIGVALAQQWNAQHRADSRRSSAASPVVIRSASTSGI